MPKFHKLVTTVTSLALIFGTSVPALAKPPGAQVFDVYDNTYDGLQVGTDPVAGQVEANANPGDKGVLIIQTHLQKAAPNCEYTVQLVTDSAASNGGLNSVGHSGFTLTLGTLTTNRVGNGNAHFEVEVGDGTLDTQMYGHIDFEDFAGTCEESDGTPVVNNEFGAAPDPALTTPFTWWE